MALVYVVDDEANIRHLAALGLQDAGYETVEFSTGSELLAALTAREPDCVVLDWMMPQPDGLEVCRRMRAENRWRHIPVIMLTARADEVDKILGLELGADDYLTKPFSVKELSARVKSLIRRGDYLASKDELMRSGELELDSARHRVTKNGQEIALSLREYELLYELMKHPGRVLTREILLNRVWKTDFVGDTRTVDVHVRYLRQKIEDEPDNPRYILTVRGVGYRFAELKGEQTP